MMMHQTIERLLTGAALAAALMIAGCGDGDEPRDPAEFYGQAQEAEVEDPIEFTTENYDFAGDTEIADLVGLVPTDEFVWYGFAPTDAYPMGDERVINADCDAGTYENVVEQIDTLPATIEGVVTLHPRFFQKVPVCGQDNRFYGSFFIQDQSGGILVLHDARIADFSFGDRVKMRVRGLMTSFDQPAVLISDQREVVDFDAEYPIYYEEVTGPFETDDVGKVRRIEGVITSEPANYNFNEAIVQGDDGTEWAVSIDRELGTRGVPLYQGDRVRFTGPVINSYGLNLVVASLGQIEWLDE